MKARYKAILMLGTAMLIMAILFVSCGYNNTWRLWNIPTMSPHFADLRSITHGPESLENGFDPMVDNPGDPWKRELNYPRIWQSLYSIGINHTHTTCLGIIFILSFLIGVCLFLPHASTLTVALVFAAVLSPATLLGAERGNTDLLMFFLASVSIVIAQRSYMLSIAVLLTGFVLKLFPIFGCIILLKATRSKFILYTSIILTFAGFYALATLSDLALINEGTQKSRGLSYGMNVIWMGLSSSNATAATDVKFLSCFSVLLISAFAFPALLSNDQASDQQRDTVSLSAFRAGSAIYIGTFLLGNNWDYRLIFLIFTLPQLVLWAKGPIARISTASKITIAAIFISLWHLVILQLLGYLPHNKHIGFVLDEVSNWIAFSGLLYLLFWSMPSWVKEVAQKTYSRIE